MLRVRSSFSDDKPLDVSNLEMGQTEILSANREQPIRFVDNNEGTSRLARLRDAIRRATLQILVPLKHIFDVDINASDLRERFIKRPLSLWSSK